MNPEFPLAFRDVQYMALLYRADAQAVSKQLEQTPFKPALQLLGEPVVAVGLIQYKDSDLGSYDEIIISIPVILKKDRSGTLSNWLDLYAKHERKRGGQYIIHIPVTSQVSVDGGRNLWGYPKTLEPIHHQFNNNRIDSRLNAPDGTNMINWKGPLGMGITIPAMNLMTYSFLHEKLVRTCVDVKAQMKWYPMADISCSIVDKGSSMIKDMIALGIDRRKPLAVLGAPHFSALFHAPQEMH